MDEANSLFQERERVAAQPGENSSLKEPEKGEWKRTIQFRSLVRDSQVHSIRAAKAGWKQVLPFRPGSAAGTRASQQSVYSKSGVLLITELCQKM